uniref:Putative secreted protein n=1 Tax=Amblyomma parvum TaxID=251391 RepID=A0A023G004_AMBPA
MRATWWLRFWCCCSCWLLQTPSVLAEAVGTGPVSGATLGPETFGWLSWPRCAADVSATSPSGQRCLPVNFGRNRCQGSVARPIPRLPLPLAPG